MGFFLLGANYALYGVAPVFYPGAIRDTGSGASVAVGRIGSIMGPLLAGFMMSELGRLPLVGDTVEVQTGVLRVDRLDRRRIDRIRFTPNPPDGGEDS